MKLQRTPLILVVAALLLGGIVALQEAQRSSKPADSAAQSEKLFGFQEGEVQTLQLTTPTQTLAFEKPLASAASPSPTAQPTSSPADPKAPKTTWTMTKPTAAPANDASVAYLLNLLATGTKQQALTVPVARRAEFGLDRPIATAEVKLFNQTTHRITLGKPNFNRSGLYAAIDPPADPQADLPVALVSMDFANAVNRPLAEWQAAKPSPSPSASATPAPKSSQ